MERLVTTSEAADLLNLSIQGVHYRIKQGQLKSIKENGKVFVYVDKSLSATPKNTQTKKEEIQHIPEQTNEIVNVKDEQIALLNKTIKWIKNRYESEIKRLEKNQKRMIQVFQSEISLLQSAFNEMRSIYRIDHKETIHENKESKFNIISVNEFFLLMKKHGKNDVEIKKIILTALHKKDKRFFYDKDLKEIIIYKSDFLDLI